MAIVSALTACANFPLPPVNEQGRPVRQPEARYRVVQPGDTLYSISWESGRDYQDVARWNGIAPPYLIYPGQRIRLYPPAAEPPAHPPSSAAPARAKNDSKTRAPTTTAPAAPTANLSWVWPTQGDLIERFSANGPNKGIDIAGKIGQPVVAAEEGHVVYQGGGLRGYGQLIIIKHNDDFLSAYAHCDRIYVKEGNVVKRGQKIADMGRTGTDTVKLHFEIRYRGAPVDPQKYLPRK